MESSPNSSHSFKIIWTLAFAMVISVMNSTMFNVALPVLRQEFGLTSSEVSWVVTAYIIVYAVGSVTYGKLADRFPLKNLITAGLVLFAAGSLLGLFSTSYWMIIAGRILQSMGASVIPASSMLIPMRYIPGEKRGRALGITSAGMALGTAIGPIIAGFIIGLVSWRFLFLISLLVLLSLPLFRRHLPEESSQPGRTDLAGGLLLAAGIALLLLSITQRSWALFGLTLAVFALFYLRIHRTADPFVSPGIFRNAKYTAGLIIGCMILTLNLCVPYLVPQMLSSVNGLSSMETGVVMFPGALLAALLGLVGGRIADSKGNRFLAACALLLQAASYLLLSTFTGASPLLIAVLLILTNTGLTFAQIGMAGTVSRTLTGRQTGVGMGIYMMASFITGAVGTTLIGAVLDGGSSASSLNPMYQGQGGGAFSSVFLIFAAWIIGFVALYFTVFRQGREKPVGAG
ncbi:DHA2 family metal-tetracycline-proton antiporter-like MFS transporter [Paenibacillus mucilaginosus]|uniref:MFS transporter n=1 Tax=Paenibacillus mucilaginosus TaxID=61624 RepID=UPI003D248744